MQIAEFLKDERLTLQRAAAGIGVANLRAVQRYRDGERIPDRKRMRQLVIFTEGRVTPNDIYGLTELIGDLLQRRADRLAGRKPKREPHPELPFADQPRG